MTATPDEPTKQVRVTSSWTPLTQPAEPSSAPREPRELSAAARGAATVPLTLLLIVNLVGIALVNVPELRFPELLRAFGQFGTLVVPAVVTFGANTSGAAITIALVGAVLLAVVVRSGAQNSLPVVGGAAALTAVPLLVALAVRLADPAPAQRVAAGLLLGLLAVGSALSVPVRLARGGSAPSATGARLFWLFGAYLVVVVVPYAVGRAAAGAGLLTVGPTVWQPYLAGLTIGLVVWAVAQAFPPFALRRYGVALFALAVALGPLLDMAAGRY